MQDIEDTVCQVIEAIIDDKVESISVLADGTYIPFILEKIDSKFFKSNNKQLVDWDYIQDHLESFLEEKNIEDGGLELNIQEIKKGNPEQICFAVLQIFAILVTFNKPEWDKIMKLAGFLTYTHITKMLDKMVKALNDLVGESKKRHSSDNTPKIAELLIKLERKEDQIAIVTKEKDSLMKQVLEKNNLITNFEKITKEKDNEIQGLNDVNKKITNQLVTLEAMSKHIQEDDIAVNEKVIHLDKEISNLKLKLQNSNTYILDKEIEIGKLQSLIKNLDEEKCQNEDLIKQVDNYKFNFEEFKKKTEIYENKINSLLNFETELKNFQKELLEEQEKNLKLGQDLSEKRSIIDNLQQRIDGLESSRRVTSSRRNLMVESSDVYSMELIKTLENETKQQKRIIEELKAKELSTQRQISSERNIEKENQVLRAQIASFLSTGDLRSIESPKNGNISSLSKIEKNHDDKNDLVDKISSFDNNEGMAGHITKSSGESMEDFALIYSSVMAFYKNEVAEQRKYVHGGNERERSIFKQFMLTDMLLAESNVNS